MVTFWYCSGKPCYTQQRDIGLLIGVAVATMLAYIVLYIHPPLDAISNATFATAMIASIAGYIFQMFKTSNQPEANSGHSKANGGPLNTLQSQLQLIQV